MATISVPFEEHHDSPKLGGNRSGEFSFSRKFVVAYGDLYTFLDEMFRGGTLGLPQTFSHNWSALYADTWSVEYPNANATGNFTMTDPESQAIGHDGGVFVNITYTPIKINATDDPPLPDGSYIEYSKEDASEFVTLPGRSLLWETDNQLLPSDRNPVMFVPEARHVLTWSRVQSVPEEEFSALKGKVNELSYRLPGLSRTFAPESLLFESATDSGKLHTSFNPSDPPLRQVVLTFVEKSQTYLDPAANGAVGSSSVYGWNHQFREDQGIYDRPVTAAGDPMFQVADFGAMFP